MTRVVQGQFAGHTAQWSSSTLIFRNNFTVYNRVISEEAQVGRDVVRNVINI